MGGCRQAHLEERLNDLYMGNRDGAVERALAYHWCVPGLIPGPALYVGYRKSVVGSRPFSEGFPPSSPVFLLPQKPTLSNSNSIKKTRPHKLWALNTTVIFYSILFLISYFVCRSNDCPLERFAPVPGLHYISPSEINSCTFCHRFRLLIDGLCLC